MQIKKLGNELYMDIAIILLIIRHLISPNEFSTEYPYIVYATLSTGCYVLSGILEAIYILKEDHHTPRKMTDQDLRQWNRVKNILYVSLLVYLFGYRLDAPIPLILFILFCLVSCLFIGYQVYFIKTGKW